mmetsp:Transcript_37230/g.57179  ORF Transcript_37230/g.57179 Transcript_37230/m.57179 type:complete len:160 (+) Transcript_37230:44-523(+)
MMSGNPFDTRQLGGRQLNGLELSKFIKRAHSTTSSSSSSSRSSGRSSRSSRGGSCRLHHRRRQYSSMPSIDETKENNPSRRIKADHDYDDPDPTRSSFTSDHHQSSPLSGGKPRSRIEDEGEEFFVPGRACDWGWISQQRATVPLRNATSTGTSSGRTN